MQKFVRFYPIESDIKLAEEISENGIAARPSELHVPILHHCVLYIFYRTFYVMSSAKISEICSSQILWEKNLTTAPSVRAAERFPPKVDRHQFMIC